MVDDILDGKSVKLNDDYVIKGDKDDGTDPDDIVWSRYTDR